MAIEVKLPQISEDADTGTVSEILVSKGDTIEKEDPIIVVESDKASVEVPSSKSGKVSEIKVNEGDEVKVGTVILTLEENGEKEENTDTEKKEKAKEEGSTDAEAKEEQVEEEESEEQQKEEKEKEKAEKAEKDEEKEETKEEAEEEKTPAEEEEKKAAESTETKERVNTAPWVKRLARELGVSLKEVEPSGPEGRILADDLTAYARKRLQSGGLGEPELPDFSKWGFVKRESLGPVKKATVKSMRSSWNTIPHVTHFDKSDITSLEDFRQQHSDQVEKAGGKLTVTSILLKICAGALREFPRFNASLDVRKEELIMKDYVNISVAVDTDRGLLVPVLRDADKKSLTQLSVELTEIAEQAREGKLDSESMKGGNFSISNLGGIGGNSFTPIVYHPQVAILGVSRARMEPVYRDEQFNPRMILPLSLSYDHRVIDGAEAARFLRWVCEVMEDPFAMILEGGVQ